MANPLLTTKLYPSPLRSRLVFRPRLDELLEDGLRQRRKAALISAPAGFGKTTLVIEAVERTGHTTAWLSLDRADNDLVRFWQYVTAAMRRANPAVGELAQTMLEQTQPPPVEIILTSLLNDLAGLPEPLLLVLDDYHVVETGAIHESLNYFLDHLAPGVFLLITTRSDPPLALARRRSRMELVEVRAADLRFTQEEALHFLNEAMRLGLSNADVDSLVRRTEGWIAGLQMAALAMQGLEAGQGMGSGDARRDFIHSFAGDDHYIGDYLVEEVLQRQPPEIQAFLLQTSVLQQLSAPLCEAVMEGEAAGLLPAQEALSYLEHANLFLTPLDNRQEWFRYHRLFADLLQRRLGQLSGSEKVKEIHRRASRWYEQRALWAEAVEHALAAGDTDHAVGLVEAGREEMFLRSEMLTFRELVLRLPREQVLANPGLCVAWGWAALSTGHVDETAQAVEAVEQLLGLTDDALNDSSFYKSQPEGLILLLINLAVQRVSLDMTHMDVHSAIRRSKVVLDCLAYYEGKSTLFDPLDFSSVAYFELGLGYEALGETERAADTFIKAVGDSEKAGNLHVLPMAIGHLAHIQVVRGRLKEAAETYNRALENAAQVTGRPSPLVSVAHSGLGAVLYEWNELDAAEEQLERTLALGKPLNNWESLQLAYPVLARLLAVKGHKQRALDLLDEADQGWKQNYHQAAYPGFLAWKALLLGDQALIEQAAQGFEEGRPPVEVFQITVNEMDQHLRARLWIALGQTEKARAILEPVFQQAYQKERWGMLIQNLILQSVVAFKQQALAQALDCLKRALDLARPNGYVRSFVDEGAPVARLLYTISRSSGEDTQAARHANRLLAAFPADVFEPAPEKAASEKAEQAAGLVFEPLTEREIEILGLVALGLSNSAIAARLVITTGTVKVHTNNIYAKLGVNSRTAAVAKARLLGFLA